MTEVASVYLTRTHIHFRQCDRANTIKTELDGNNGVCSVLSPRARSDPASALDPRPHRWRVLDG